MSKVYALMKHDKGNGAKGLKMRFMPSSNLEWILCEHRTLITLPVKW